MTAQDYEIEQLREAFAHTENEKGSGTCPSDEEIWAACRGELPPERTKQLLAHSQDCPACAKSFTMAAGLAVEARIAETIRPFRPRRRMLYAVGAVAAGVILAVTLVGLLRTGPAAPLMQPLENSVQATLWRVGSAEDEPLTGDETLGVGDRLYLAVESEVPVHLYVINRDGTGDTSALFPVDGAQWSNPLAPGTYRIPGETTWRYDSWEVSSSGGQETFQVIASNRPLVRLEAALGRVDEAVGEFIRGEGPAPSDPGGADALAAVLADLQSTVGADLMIREIVLQNPADR